MQAHLPTPTLRELQQWCDLSQCSIAPHLFNEQSCSALRQVLEQRFSIPHGDMVKWESAIDQLPKPSEKITVTTSKKITVLDANGPVDVQEALKQLRPWRKGPWHFFGTDVDSEWQSDRKWDRFLKSPICIKDHHVLDIGSGNGYYGWQMMRHQAASVIGVDASLLLSYQFYCVKPYCANEKHFLFPLRFSQFPKSISSFDTVFCMGFLSHSRSPIQSLREIRDRLLVGGNLVLETLVLDEKTHEILKPKGRYAMMNNVYFIPPPSVLIDWLRVANFSDIHIQDISNTSVEEQRSTEWMTSHSLADFLNPENHNQTIEGHPAPSRILLTAVAH